MKYTIQEKIGNHFLDRAVELLKQGKTFVFVLDNIDWEVKTHDMRSDKQNTSVHAVATSIVFDRVSSTHLPDGPKKTLSECNLIDLLTLTEEEIQCTRDRYKIFIARVLCESFPSFDFLKEVVPARTPCQHAEEMSSQSVVVPLHVLIKDEKKSIIIGDTGQRKLFKKFKYLTFTAFLGDNLGNCIWICNGNNKGDLQCLSLSI